nr:class I SAM-dependent methyltransferase [Nocardioides ginsengisegetis]
MLAHQVRLIGRSARDIVLEPGRGRDLHRLLATRGRSTLTLRLPWLPFALIDRLDEVIGAGSRVFEYGGGGSTLWFLDRGAEVVTVEHDHGWTDALTVAVSSEQWTLIERSSADAYAAYVGAINDYPDGYFDLVVVDGRERARCVTAARSKVRPGGLLLVDDVDREPYASALTNTHWPREDFVGFAPAKPSLAYSAIFRRPGGDG